MSPAPAKGGERAFDQVKIPVFHLTGTKDTSPLDADLKPEDRTQPYKQTKGPNQYLLVLKDADHMTFSGRGKMAKQIAPTIVKATTAFLDAHLRGDAKQEKWLEDSFANELGIAGRFEHK